MNVEEALRALSDNHKDIAAWKIVVTEVYQPLLAYVASLLLTFRAAPGDEGHDIVHETLISFHKTLHSNPPHFNSIGDLNAYLRKSCRNHLIDRYKHNKRAEQMVDYLQLNFSRSFQDRTHPDTLILSREIISLLPNDCASIFKQYVIEDLSLADIADRNGIPHATFYTRWYRCLQKSKEILMKRKVVHRS